MENAENRMAAASYVIELYKQIESLGAAYNALNIGLKFFETRFKANERDNKFFQLDDNEVQAFRTYIITFHSLATSVYIKIVALREERNELKQNADAFDKLFHEKIDGILFPERKDAFEFVRMSNSYFVSGLSKMLLQNAFEAYNQYGSNAQE